MIFHKNFSNSRHFYYKLYIKNENEIRYLVRPYLKFTRFELLKICEFWKFPIFPDYTNWNYCFRRNRLRSQVLPYFQFFFNINLIKKIEQFQNIYYFENKYFEFMTSKISFSNFFYFPQIFQYRIIYNFFYQFQKKISFQEIVSIIVKLK